MKRKASYWKKIFVIQATNKGLVTKYMSNETLKAIKKKTF